MYQVAGKLVIFGYTLGIQVSTPETAAWAMTLWVRVLSQAASMVMRACTKHLPAKQGIYLTFSNIGYGIQCISKHVFVGMMQANIESLNSWIWYQFSPRTTVSAIHERERK